MGESFFQRWSRRKSEQAGAGSLGNEPSRAGINPGSVAPPVKAEDEAPDRALPTLDDVARLTRDSDYSLFLDKGVDRNIRRAAMKKLFTDPHFNVMDGLDIYIDDYTKPSPLTPAMLAALQHSQSMFEAIANEARAREEREKREKGKERAPESEPVPANALPEQVQDGDAEPQGNEPTLENAQADPAEPVLPRAENLIAPNQEDGAGTSIRHSA